MSKTTTSFGLKSASAIRRVLGHEAERPLRWVAVPSWGQKRVLASRGAEYFRKATARPPVRAMISRNRVLFLWYLF